MEDTFEFLLGSGVITTFVIFVWQSYRAQKAEDERTLAQARLLLMRLIGLEPNDPLAAIQGGDAHFGTQSMAERRQMIADTRVELENTALAIRGKKLRNLAGKILEVAEPPLGDWNEDLAMWLMGETKLILNEKVIDARKDPNALDD